MVPCITFLVPRIAYLYGRADEKLVNLENTTARKRPIHLLHQQYSYDLPPVLTLTCRTGLPRELLDELPDSHSLESHLLN
uniref:Uncharacterized protein n=1 Tax=Picea glauca TaxID=3330 RepID=A0A101LVL4_PICGL|nr:hypothetical protein ABT39_MTgene1972 [Picea glauca]